MDKSKFKEKVLEELDIYINDTINEKIKNELLKVKDFVIHKPEKNKKAYIRIHEGLGDLINMIGTIRYLFHFYNDIVVYCNNNNLKNAIEIFKDETRITFTSDLTINRFKTMMYDIYDAGYGNKIYDDKFRKVSTENIFLKLNKALNNRSNRHFIERFYTFINLNFSVYSDFFYLPITEESINLYNSIKDFKITFIHEGASDMPNKNLLELIENEKDEDIVICANRNYYNDGSKKDLAEKFINIPILLYLSVIINSNKILITDSCFSSIILPLMNKKVCKCEDVTIYRRDWHNYIEDICDKVNIIVA